jgi:CHAT domain-containing protein
MATTLSARRLSIARAASSPEIAEVWNAWKQSDELLVQARVDVARDPSAKNSTALHAAERAFDDAERALAEATGKTVASTRDAKADLPSVRATLPKDMALVRFIEADSSEPRDLQRPDAERHGRLYAFVATRNVPPQLLDLGPLPAVKSAVSRWLDLVVDRNGDAAAREDAGRQVREQIWDPIRKQWPQKRVLVVASPALERIPFAALPAEGGRYLVESGYTFHLLDHERDALMPNTKPDARAMLSIIGAPDFSVDARVADTGTRGVCAGLRGATFSPLPQAEREIDQLRALWIRRAGATAPTVLTGSDANEARARAVLPGSRIIHFATHGLFLGAQCRDGASTDRRGLKTVDVRSSSALAEVNDFSALVLSGANRPAASTDNDGLLTSEEIATLDLNGTDWAVLSACDTGIGKDVSGEGVFGLRRAFRLAGARSVVMSLWEVSDSASADWMVALYRARLEQHATTMDSVRAADLALIKQRRDAGLDAGPFYWAAFVAAGSWH